MPMAMATIVFAAIAATLGVAQRASGTIDGAVTDQTGARLPGVTVTLTQVALGVSRTAVTDASGTFLAPMLPLGEHLITASLAGFKPYGPVVLHLTVGQTLTLKIVLAVADVALAVTVSDAAPILETSRSHVSSTVDEQSIRHLPVNGRSFIDFVLLTPGVTRDIRTGDLSFAGQRGTLNSLIVDGVDNNHTFAGQTLGRTGSGRAPYQFSQDAVQEFQVNSNAYSAEFGRAGGAVINVVTRSGTNDIRGSLFEFYRDKALNATSVINRQNNLPKSPYTYHQFGGTIGGPLRVNRDFFFFAYDGQRHRQPNDVFLNLPATTPDDAATRAGIELLRPLAESWTRTLDQDVFLSKTDHQVRADDRLTLRYNHQNFTGEGFEAGGPQNSLEHTGASLVRTRTFQASWASVFGSRAFNEVRVQYARDHEPGTANSDKPEAVVRQSGSLVLIAGRNNFSPRANTIDRVQLADTLTWIRGRQQLTAGMDVQLDRIRNDFPGFFGGSYVFQSLASFARGRPDGANELYQQNFAGPGTSGSETRPDLREYAAFVQSEWRRQDLTLSSGLRYDLMAPAGSSGVRNPDPQLAAAGIDTSRFEPDTNNWGPRVGVAWSPHGRPWVVRGGWGFFYGRTPAIAFTSARANNGVNTILLTLRGDAVPTYPSRFSEIPSGGPPVRPSIFFIDRDFANPRVSQANLAVERSLDQETTLALTYLRVHGRQLPRSVDRNLGTVGQRTFTVAGTGDTLSYPFFNPASRPFTNFQRVVGFESTAESTYNGLTAELNRRFARDLQFRVAYTLGKVEDTVPEATAVLPGNMDDVRYVSNPLNYEADRAVGNNDQRHRLVGSGILRTDRLAHAREGFTRSLVGGWAFSAIVAAQSGQPYSARVGGVDLNGDGNALNDLAPGTRRNAFRLPAIVTIDSRIAREIRITSRVRTHVIWEAFNLLDRDNISFVSPAYYTVLGTTLSRNSIFGRPLASAGERIMQLAVRLTY